MWRKRLRTRYSYAMDRDEIIDVLRAFEDTVRPLDHSDAERLKLQFDLEDD